MQEKGDVKALTGSWTFEDLGEGRTRATYALEAEPGRMLGMLLRGPVEAKVRDFLLGDAADGLKQRGRGRLVSEYTKVNLVKDVEDMAPGFGVEGIQARFARKHLELTKGGIGLFRIEPNVRTPWGHVHSEQEEIYVVVKGSARFAVVTSSSRRRSGTRSASSGRVAGHGGRARRRRGARLRRAVHGEQGRRARAGLVARGGGLYGRSCC